MKKIIQTLTLFAFMFFLNGCASIISQSSYPFTVNTNPSGANVVIKDGKGIEIFSGKSPATVKLDSGAGFFKKASYTVKVSGEGYDEQTLPINFKLDGWYFGNLLLGGFIGMLIVDPVTGAMYKLDDEYMNINLSSSSSRIDTPRLKVYDLTSIPKEWKETLIKLNP